MRVVICHNEAGIMLDYRIGQLLWLIPKIDVVLEWLTGRRLYRVEHNVIRDSYWLSTDEEIGL